MKDTIELCQKSLGKAPREFSPGVDKFLRVNAPEFLLPDDRLHYHFKNLSHLYRTGKIVWGHIVQANGLLFSKGPDDLPGEMIYAPSGDVDPSDLWEIAEEVFALKETRPNDPELRKIALYITDEKIRTYYREFPSKIITDKNFRLSTTWFVRKHLPGGVLRCPLLPIIMYPGCVGVVTPLPARYWPDEFTKWWMAKKFWE